MAILRFSGILALIFLGFGILGGLVLGSFTQVMISVHLILGVLCLVVWMFAGGLKNVTGVGSAMTGRRARFSYNLVLYSVVFIGLLICANWFANKYDKRWDLTKEGVYSLSSQSETVIKNLDKPIKIVAITESEEASPDAVKELLGLYKYYNPTKVTTEELDPRAKPHLVDKYEMKQGNLVYIEYGEGDNKAVNRLNAFNEQEVTNAILKLSRGASKKIYYVEGHDEPALDADEETGTKDLANALGDENLKIESILLSQKSSVPDDAAAVFLMSPKKPLLKEEVDALIKYAENGGRLVLFQDPRQTADVKTIAAHFGIEVGDNVVIDQIQRLFAAPALGAQPIIRDYGAHPITRQLTKRDITIFNIASSVKPSASKDKDASYTELLKSSPTAWAETDLSSLFNSAEPSALLDEKSDLAGPVSMAVAYEKKIVDPSASDQNQSKDPKFQKSARVVVFGDSDWVLNANLAVYSHRDLILNTINWLIGEEGGISIRPRSVGLSAAPIPENTFFLILFCSFVAPELILILGLYIWWQRKTALA